MRSSKKQKSWRLLPVLAACLLAATGAFGTWLALAPGTQNFDGATKVSLQNLDANVRTIAATITASPTISATRVAGIVLPAEPGGWGLYLAPTTRFLCFGKIGVSEVCSSQSVTLGTAHHVASTFDGSTVNLYVDGISSGSKPYKETFDAKGAPYLIGGTRYEKWNSDNFFIGSIGNVRAYSSALDATQIATLATGKLSNAEFALIGSWLGDAPPPPSPVCGDGICQNIPCIGGTCPALETPESCPQDCKSKELLIGDVNGDGTFGAADTILVQRHIAGSNRITDPAVFKRADADASGVIDNADVLLVQARGLGIIAFLPAKFGDLNHDLQYGAADTILAQRHVLGTALLSAGDQYLADVNRDDTVNNVDVTLIQRAGLGLETLPTTSSQTQSSAGSARPVCGDGICQNAACTGTNCPVQETPGTCPQDCSCPMMMCPPTEPGCRYESTGKDANGCENTCGKLVCDQKPVTYCGDGIVQDKEQCDDKNRRPGDGCSSQCMKEFCGDKIVTPSQQEQCDEGNAISGDGCSATCAFEYCGDGAVQAALGETCDDGNLVLGDGCDRNCKTEGQIVPPPEKTPLCGDGICQNIPCIGGTCPALETPESCPQDCKSKELLIGDVNGDGTFGAADTILVQRHIAGSNRITDPAVFKRADADASGVIDNADVLLVQARGLGIIAFLPAKFGDLNHNLRLDEEDSVIAQRIVVAGGASPTDNYLADVNMDGKVNGADAGFIMRAVAGLVTLPVTASSSQSSVSARPATVRVPNGVSDDLFGGAVPNVDDTLALQLQEDIENLSFPTAQKYLQAVSDDLRKKAIVNNGAMVIMDSRTGKSINIPNPTLPNDADPTYNNALHTIDLFGAGNLDYLLMNVRYTRADNRQLATAALRYVLTGGKYTYSIIGIETAVPSANGKFAYVGNTIVNLETGTSRKYARPSLGPEDGWNRALSISNDGTKIAFEGYAVTKQANGADALTATLAIVNTATNAVSRFVPALPANEYATVGAYVLSGDFSKIFCNSTRSMRSGTTAFVGVRPYVLDPATGTTRPLLGDMQSSLESPSYPYGYLYGPAVDSAAANGNRVLLRAHIYRNKDGGGLQTTPEYWAYDLPTQKLISLTSPLESAAPNKSSTPLGLAPDGQTVLMKNENDNLVRLHKLTSVFQ